MEGCAETEYQPHGGAGRIFDLIRGGSDYRGRGEGTDEPWMVPGRFGWDGGFGTSAYSDPKNDFIGILMTQRMMDSPEPPAVFKDFWTGAYRSLEA
jgi:CubicO group peptidase (beta-lactamase class C family)